MVVQFNFPLFLGMVMYDNEFTTKENMFEALRMWKTGAGRWPIRKTLQRVNEGAWNTLRQFMKCTYQAAA